MLISHRKRFIYTKTVKTAGTSVEAYFEPYCLGEGSWKFCQDRPEYVGPEGVVGARGANLKGITWRNHMSAIEIREIIRDTHWNTYFKFCVIRNPFDKLVSAFYFFDSLRANGRRAKNWKDRLKKLYKVDPTDAGVTKDPVTRFRSWIRAGGCVIDRDKYTIDGHICLDYLIRYEDLHGGIKHVCSVLDIPFEPEKIPRLKSGIRNNEIPLHEYYDAETIEIVRSHYKFELDTFGYTEPSSRHELTHNDK
jgi:hypothetical protein